MPADEFNMKKIAIGYAATYGWQVFPVKRFGKAPLTDDGYHDASADENIISDWWGRWAGANIGLACAPSGIVALDGDPAKYDYESRMLVKMLEDHPTISQRTPADGRHWFYRLPEGETLSNSNKGLPPGFDLRVNGYVLLTPSIVTYKGKEAESKGVVEGHTERYTWAEGYSPDEIELAPLPFFVYELLKRKPERTTPPPTYVNGDGTGSRYALVALEKELDILSRTGEGGRNEQLNTSAFSLGQLVGGGVLSETDVGDKLMSVALSIGLDEREAGRTIASGLRAGKKSPRGVPEEKKVRFGNTRQNDASQPLEDTELNVLDYRAEDGGILDAWIDHCSADWLYATGHESWFRWNGSHWQLDDTLAIHRQVQGIMDAMNRQARAARSEAKAENNEDGEAIAKAYITATKRSKSRVGSVEGMAQQQMATAAATLDAGNLLNLQNGTLDIDTLEFRPHAKDNLLTYCLPYEYDYGAGCARFRQFISEVLVKDDGKTADAELALLAQELVGYSLTNDTTQEVMVWLSGEGGNGKTVAITIISKLLGPLAVNMDFQMIGVAGNYDLASLPGKRVVFSTESERGGSMAEGYIKRIVSGETITARAIYGKPFAFQSTAKIWWAMNDRPNVKDTSNAMWRRLKLIPFLRTFGELEKDTELLAKLEIELPGILNWAIEGLIRLRRQGRFTTAQAVGHAIEEYKYESNPVAQWMKEHTQPGGKTPATLAYENYSRWCTRSTNQELTSTAFGRELARLKVSKERKETGQVYLFTLAGN